MDRLKYAGRFRFWCGICDRVWIDEVDWRVIRALVTATTFRHPGTGLLDVACSKCHRSQVEIWEEKQHVSKEKAS